MPPCIDVYSLSPRRDRGTIEEFLATYAEPDQDVGAIDVLPVDYFGPVGDLPLDEWVRVPVQGLNGLATISVATPPMAFTAYLRSQRPWCGVILSCARSGEVTFGVSVDDPLNSAEPRRIAAELLRSLCEATGGTRGWAVHEMPPSVDPRAERPWDHATNVADFVG